MPDSAARQDLAGALPGMQQQIVDVVRRKTGLQLAPGPAAPVIGLNSITFEFLEREAQGISVRVLERIGQDIGVATGRDPVRCRTQGNISFEVPLFESERRFVPIKPLLLETMPGTRAEPAYLLGRRQDGSPCELPMRDARHMLVGGSTGGGKTVFLHTLIAGVAFRYRPSKVRLALADNKIFEFSQYRGLPHLWQEVVTSPEGFSNLVENLWTELRRRKGLMTQNRNRSFPVLLTIVDEFSGYNSEKLVRLVAEARALNMYFVLATQHPTVDVVSGAIKANMLTGVSFKTRDHIGSRLIIGEPGALSLKQNGDCLVQSGTLTRIQAGWVTGPGDRKPSDLGALVNYLEKGKAA
jgi:S-DNA-T family DNA segregation ATPase FtsK/SpoIIIE